MTNPTFRDQKVHELNHLVGSLLKSNPLFYFKNHPEISDRDFFSESLPMYLGNFETPPSPATRRKSPKKIELKPYGSISFNAPWVAMFNRNGNQIWRCCKPANCMFFNGKKSAGWDASEKKNPGFLTPFSKTEKTKNWDPSTWMSQEVSKWLGLAGCNLLINGSYWRYNPLTNLFLTSSNIQVLQDLSGLCLVSKAILWKFPSGSSYLPSVLVGDGFGWASTVFSNT